MNQLHSLIKTSYLDVGILASVICAAVMLIALPTEYSSPQFLFDQSFPSRSAELLGCVLAICNLHALTFREWEHGNLRSPTRTRWAVRVVAIVASCCIVAAYISLSASATVWPYIFAGVKSVCTYMLLTTIASDMGLAPNIATTVPTSYFMLSSFFTYDSNGDVSSLAFTRAPAANLMLWLPVCALCLIALILAHWPRELVLEE